MVTVTAENGSTNSYDIAVTRATGETEDKFSDDATLKSLAVSAGTLSPAFNPEHTSYTTSVANSVSSITVLAEANHLKATVLGTGTKNLLVGSNPFTVTVTAEDGSTKDYHVVITRAADSNGNTSGGGSTAITSYILTFESNGGSVVTKQTVEAGILATKPANPTKDGYVFVGWFTDKELAKEYNFNATVTGSFILYAKWTELGEDPDEKTWRNPFTDVKISNWFYDNVQYVVTQGLFQGTSDVIFTPQSTMTRAMLFTVMARLAGVETDGGETWYSLALDWAMKEGLTDGSNPQASVTREQIVTILWRYAGKPSGAGSLADFPDAASTSDWAVDAFKWAIEVGVINGKDGKLVPQGQATRAEVAAMLHRFVTLEK